MGGESVLEKEYMDHNFEGEICLERIKSKLPWDMPKMHSHNYHELYFLVSGSRKYFVGHTIYDVSPGDIVIIPQNELHRTSGGVAGYERYALYFSDALTEDFKKEMGNEFFEKILKLGSVNLPGYAKEKVFSLLKEIEQEQRKSDEFSSLVIKRALYNIFITILRHGSKIKQNSNKKIDAIEQALIYINENYAQDLSLSSVAKISYMEETYFSKRFKKLTGFGFSEYLTHTRIKVAEELLKNSDLSINEISDQCGFSGSNYFGDLFKKINGISPSAYRKSVRETNK